VNSFNENTLLTVIVPVTRMHGKMKNLFSWLNDVNLYECEVISFMIGKIRKLHKNYSSTYKK